MELHYQTAFTVYLRLVVKVRSYSFTSPKAGELLVEVANR